MGDRTSQGFITSIHESNYTRAVRKQCDTVVITVSCLQVIGRQVPIVEKRLGICYNKYQYSTERRIHEMLFLVYTDLTAHLPLRFHDLTAFLRLPSATMLVPV